MWLPNESAREFVTRVCINDEQSCLTGSACNVVLGVDANNGYQVGGTESKIDKGGRMAA